MPLSHAVVCLFASQLLTSQAYRRKSGSPRVHGSKLRSFSSVSRQRVVSCHRHLTALAWSAPGEGQAEGPKQSGMGPSAHPASNEEPGPSRLGLRRFDSGGTGSHTNDVRATAKRDPYPLVHLETTDDPNSVHHRVVKRSPPSLNSFDTKRGGSTTGIGSINNDGPVSGSGVGSKLSQRWAGGGLGKLFGGMSTYRMLYISASAVGFANAMTFAALGPFFPNYAAERFGASAAQVGFIMSTYPLMNLATSPFCGWLMGRFGRWNLLFMGLGLLTAGTAMYGLASNQAMLYLASAMHGASLSFVHVSSLALLSSFPEKLTEAMGGVEVWSGVALVISPPIGGLIYPWFGVPGVFLTLSLFPLAMLCCIPYMRRALANAKDAPPDDVSAPHITLGTVLKSRGVLAGALVTACNYGSIGFLEATLSPHLEGAMHTSPATIGFVFIFPSLVYCLTASRAESIVVRSGVKNTMLFGFFTLAMSLFLHGPSPFMYGLLLTESSARTAITAGMLIFQVGSALACVPAFTAMQGGVAHLGRGADNTVASVHSLSIGLGECIGPALGGLMMQYMPRTRLLSCPEESAAQQAADAIVNAVGETEGLGPLVHAMAGHGLGALSTSNDPCSSGFPVACTVVGWTLLLISLGAYWLMPMDKPGESHDGAPPEDERGLLKSRQTDV